MVRKGASIAMMQSSSSATMMMAPTTASALVVGSSRKRKQVSGDNEENQMPTTTCSNNSKSIITQRLFSVPPKESSQSLMIDTRIVPPIPYLATQEHQRRRQKSKQHETRKCSNKTPTTTTSIPPPSLSSTPEEQQASSSLSPSQSSISFPSRVLLKMMHKQGCDQARQHSYATLPAGFLDVPTAAQHASYTHELVTAVRQADLSYLQKTSRHLLRARHKGTGTSLLHTACRVQAVTVVHFLVHVAGVPVSVVDETGRTPLHEALWTSRPPHLFDCANILLQASPDLLLVQDVRGHMPLCYAPPEHWMAWLQHLGSGGRIERHLPRRLYAAGAAGTGERHHHHHNSNDKTR